MSRVLVSPLTKRLKKPFFSFPSARQDHSRPPRLSQNPFPCLFPLYLFSELVYHKFVKNVYTISRKIFLPPGRKFCNYYMKKGPAHQRTLILYSFLCKCLDLRIDAFCIQTIFVEDFLGRAGFTFHNVSIKTCQFRYEKSVSYYLHSTMFLLKLRGVLAQDPHQSNLHSTMFLLKPRPFSPSIVTFTHLHSTMFLLKRHLVCDGCIILCIYIPQCFY